MTRIKDLTFWQNNSYRKTLEEYRAKVSKYFKNVQADYSGNIIDSEVSTPIRQQLNKNSNKVEEILVATGINPIIEYSPPPMIGGHAQDIDVINNIFNLPRFSIEYKCVLDFIDQSIGILESDYKSSIIRTVNPAFWLSKIIEFISSIPFMVIGNIGFNQKKAEQSFFGRLAKEMIKIISWVLTCWQLAEKLGLVPTIINIPKLIGR